MTRRRRDVVEGLDDARRTQVDGTGRGRYPSATPWRPRAVGGVQGSSEGSAAGGGLVDALTLTADSQTIASGSDDVTWHNELVGLTPRAGFDGYGTPPTDTVTVPVDGVLFVNVWASWDSFTGGGQMVLHITRGSKTLTRDLPGPADAGQYWHGQAPRIAVKADDVLRVRIKQSSGSGQTLASATVELTLWHTAVRTEPPESVSIEGTATLMFASPGTHPSGLTWDGTDLWNADRDADTIYRLDPADGTVLQSFASPERSAQDLAWDGTDLWHCDTFTGTIYRLDPADGTVLQSFDAPASSPNGLTWDGTWLWHCSAATETIYRLDPADGTVLQSFDAPASSPNGLTWDGTDLWLNDPTADTIYRLDPADGTVLQSFASPSTFARSLAWDGSRLWHCDADADSIYIIE